MIKKRSVAIELRLRAEVEARKEAKRRLQAIMLRFGVGTLAVISILLCTTLDVFAKADPVIPELHGGAKQLEKLIDSKDFVAVVWYARNCKLCDSVLDDLETIDDDAERSSVQMVKINDKRLAKSYGITAFPALSFFRDEEMVIFEGDLQDEQAVLDFLTSEDSLTIPDKIEEVNAEQLLRIVDDEKYVTVLFFDDSKDSTNVLSELENIDDEADVFKIRFVRIFDLALAEDFSLFQVPALVYFRQGIPLVYTGDLMDETEVLEWLILHQSSIQDEDVVDKVSGEELEIMIRNMDHLLVLFHDRKKKSQKALAALEEVDDDCDALGVSFVQLDSQADVAAQHGIDDFPTLVYFKNEIPSVFDDDLSDSEDVMTWLVNLVEGDDIEDVNGDILEKMIAKEDKLAVLFYDEADEGTEELLSALENIDDDLDERKILFVKVNEIAAAIEYGIDERPALVLFEQGIPNIYLEDLQDTYLASKVMDWIFGEVSGDHTVEVVTDAMLDMMIAKHRHVAAFFYDHDDPKVKRTVELIETIDDEIAKLAPRVTFVRIDDQEEADEYGLELPALIFFEDGLPNIYDGNLDLKSEKHAEEVLDWVTKIAMEDNIEHVSDLMLERLLEERTHLAVYFYDHTFSSDKKAIHDLETIDDDLDRIGVLLVRIADDDGSHAEKHGVDIVPSLVLFKRGRAHQFKGDVGDEKRAIQWLKENIDV